tara:strand:- start:682 stop:6015 length:5334 start_codon:yes stop_codon:yes gene_type:complete
MKLLKTIILAVFVVSTFAYGFVEKSFQLGPAHTFENIPIVDNKISYSFDLPNSTEVALRLFIADQTEIQNFKIILSDGTEINTTNADANNITIDTFTPDSAIESLISSTKAFIVTIETAPSGNTQIFGDVIGSTNSSILLDLKYAYSAMAFGTTSQPDLVIHPNEEITFSQWIVEAGEAPLNTGAADLKVYKSGALLASHTMNDDGLLNDYEASDGVFTKSLTFSDPGRHTVVIESVITDKDGFIHKNTYSEIVEITPSAGFSLSGTFTEELIDTNNNGLADKLKLVFAYTTPLLPGEKYNIQVSIGGDTIFYDQQRLTIDDSTTEIILEFSGLKIGERHTDGIIKINDVRIRDLNTMDLIDVISSFGETSSYLKAQFERKNEIIVQDSAVITMIDADNNNIYEGINISFTADVLTQGDYQGRGRLRDTNEKEVLGDVDLSLTSGIHAIDLFIPASDITNAGINGPADFKWFKFYRYDDNDWEMVEKSKFGETSSFNCWDFGDCSASLANALPVAGGDVLQGIETFGSIKLDTLLSNDSDADGDDLIINPSGYSTPSNGIIGISSEDGSLIYQPNSGFSGVDSFTYILNDFYPPNAIPKGGESTGNVQVNIRSNTQSSPSVDNFDITMDQATTLNVLSNDVDADGDTLFITAIDQPSNGQVSIINDEILYTPNLGYTGFDTFAYYIKEKDDATGLIGTTTYGAGVALNIIPPNENPIANMDVYNLSINEQQVFNVLGNDSDPDGDSISIDSVSPTQFGTAIKLSDTQIQYTAPALAASDSFTYIITDGKGGTAQGTVNIEVTVPNYAPVANDDTGSMLEGDTTLIDVLVNDSDQNNDALTIVSVQSATTPAKGDILIENNQIRFNSYLNQGGIQLITYTISDPQGLTDQAQLSLRVNNLPEPISDNYTILKEQPVNFNVLLNDTDIDGDTLSLSSVTSSANASIVIEGDSVKYTPNTGFLGNDSFSYVVDDGYGGLAGTTVTVFINSAPTATDDNFNFVLNNEQIFDILVNDYDDNAGDTIQLVSVGSANNGVASLENGQIRYVPSYNYIGLDQFTYTVEDSYGSQSTATVHLTIYEQAPEMAKDLFVRSANLLNVISWAPVKNAFSYRLYFGTSINDVNNKIQYIDTNNTSYLHQNLVNGTRYYYALESRGVSTVSPVSSIVDSMPNTLTWNTNQRIYDYGDSYSDSFFNNIDTAWDQNSNGIIHALIERKNTKLVAKSYHPKKGWGKDHFIFEKPDEYQITYLAVDTAESGHGIVIAKSENNIFASIYDPDTETWSTTSVIVDYVEGSSTTSIYNLRVAINNNGKAVVGWQGPSYYGDASIKTYSPETGWSSNQTVDSTSTLQVEDLKLAINDIGSVVVSLAYDNRTRTSEAATSVTTIIDGVKKFKNLSITREPYLDETAAATPYIDNLNNIRIISSDLNDHYFDNQLNTWSQTDIYPILISSLGRFEVKFGKSIDEVVLMYDEFNSSEPPYILISESIGNWSIPISVPTEAQSIKTILANTVKQVVVEGLSNAQNYTLKGKRLTWDKSLNEWSVEEIYEGDYYLGHPSDLLLADGYGNVSALTNGHFSEYRVIDTARNSSPNAPDFVYLDTDESTDMLFEAVNIVDMDGDIVSWKWEHVSGPFTLFLNPNEATTETLIGTTDGDDISISKLTVTDSNNNISEALFSIPVKDVTPGKDTVVPVTTASINNWSSKGTKYKDVALSSNEADSIIYWMYSGEDLFNGGGYLKDVWYVYTGKVGFKINGAGGIMYYYSIDRSGNREVNQDTKIGGKGK